MGLFDRQKTAEEIYNEGETYYDRGDYSNAVKCYLKAAKKNHPDAIYSLGFCYYYQKGIELDYREAFRYFCQAADMGHVKSQLMVGICYVKGDGVTINENEAIRYWTMAAAQGSKEAQHNIDWLNYCNNDEFEIGRKLIFGDDSTATDVQRGLNIVQKGIDLGNDPDAVYLMGRIQITGMEPYVPQNIEAGVMKLVNAAKNGEVSALYDLINIHSCGNYDGIEVHIDDNTFGRYVVDIANEIDTIEREEWGRNQAYLYAAWAYTYGYGVRKDAETAKIWISKLLPIIIQGDELAKKLLKELGL